MNSGSGKTKEVRLFGSLKVMAISALLLAMSIICGKYLAIPGGHVLRFSFENLPILLGGMMFGPLLGMVIGVGADLIGCLIVGYSINPLVTLGAAAVGFVGGGLYRFCRRLPAFWRTLISVVGGHLVGSVGIKTFGLAIYYQMPIWELMLWRLLNYLIVGAVEFFLIWLILRNRAVQANLNGLHADLASHRKSGEHEKQSKE